MMVAIGFLATLASATLLMILGWRDPKRLRTHREHLQSGGNALSRSARRALAIAALAPGCVLALAALWQPFLIWLGGVCTFGWLAVQGFSRISRGSPRMP